MPKPKENEFGFWDTFCRAGMDLTPFRILQVSKSKAKQAALWRTFLTPPLNSKNTRSLSLPLFVCFSHMKLTFLAPQTSSTKSSTASPLTSSPASSSATPTKINSSSTTVKTARLRTPPTPSTSAGWVSSSKIPSQTKIYSFTLVD